MLAVADAATPSAAAEARSRRPRAARRRASTPSCWWPTRWGSTASDRSSPTPSAGSRPAARTLMVGERVPPRAARAGRLHPRPQGFRCIELKVDARVLIPRPETELLVEEARARLPRARASTTWARARVPCARAQVRAARPRRHGLRPRPPAPSTLARHNAERLSLDVPVTVADGPAPWRVRPVVANLPYVREDEWGAWRRDPRVSRATRAWRARRLDAIRARRSPRAREWPSSTPHTAALEHAPRPRRTVRTRPARRAP